MEKIKEIVAENLSVEIIPDGQHEFLMSTNEVVKGYGVSDGSIRKHKMEHRDELVEGKHFITLFNGGNAGVSKSNAGCISEGYQIRHVLWTKRGIVRLGFFIRSERAKLFRDWAEDLVVNKVEEAERIVQQSAQLSLWPVPAKRNHNRLTKERLLDIMADVAKIEDKALRLSLIDKLTNIKG